MALTSPSKRFADPSGEAGNRLEGSTRSLEKVAAATPKRGTKNRVVGASSLEDARGSSQRLDDDGEDDYLSDGTAAEDDGFEGSVVSGVTDRYGFMCSGEPPDSTEGTGGAAGRTEEDTVDLETLRKREMKWLDMLNNWVHFMSKEYKKVRSRCRKGIPPSVRPKAWLYLCGGIYLMKKNKGRYLQLCSYDGENKWLEDIEKDLHRNFPTHELFGGAYERIGQKELFNVLKAYSVHNSQVGYCQAQAPIAALLLMNMPSEEAFWCLVSICDRYLKDYYSAGMEMIQLDGDILFGLLRGVSPAAHKHLKHQSVEPILYMTEWFLCAFTRTLPWGSVLRIWDMFMCEGIKVLFKVGLVLLKHTLGSSRQVRARCPTMYETLTTLKDLPPHITSQRFLVQQVLSLNIEETDMQKEHIKQLERRNRLKRQQGVKASSSAINGSLS